MFFFGLGGWFWFRFSSEPKSNHILILSYLIFREPNRILSGPTRFFFGLVRSVYSVLNRILFNPCCIPHFFFQLNMLCPFMEGNIMTQSFIAPNIGNHSSLRKDFIQTKSVAALATARYLASAEDLTTNFAFCSSI